jgi:uncharacterized membrane protein YbhN (UPF0104 family)
VPDELDSRRLRRRLLQLAALVWAVGMVVLLGPGLDRLRDQLLAASAAPLVIAAGLEVLSVLSYVVIFRAVFCPRMRWRTSYRIGVAEQAANSLIPAGGAGGLALGAWALRRDGYSVEHISRRTVAFFLLTSAANVGLLIAFAVMFELGLLQGDTAPALTYGAAAAAAAACIVTVALPKLVARAKRERPRTTNPGRVRAVACDARDAIGDGIQDALVLLRDHSPGVLAGSLGWLAFDIAVLIACFASFGHPPPFGVIVVAYLIGQLGGLLPLPGGIGGVEGGLIGTFVVYHVPLATASAGVLAYRGLALWIPTLLGSVAFVRLHRDLRRARDRTGTSTPQDHPVDRGTRARPLRRSLPIP